MNGVCCFHCKHAVYNTERECKLLICSYWNISKTFADWCEKFEIKQKAKTDKKV